MKHIKEIPDNTKGQKLWFSPNGMRNSLIWKGGARTLWSKFLPLAGLSNATSSLVLYKQGDSVQYPYRLSCYYAENNTHGVILCGVTL